MMYEWAAAESTGLFGVLLHIFCSPGKQKEGGKENHGMQNQEQFAHSVRLKRSERTAVKRGAIALDGRR